MPPCLFVIKKLRILMSRGPWERGRIKSGIKRAPCKARQNLPFMTIAEAKNKNKQTNKKQSMSSNT